MLTLFSRKNLFYIFGDSYICSVCFFSFIYVLKIILYGPFKVFIVYVTILFLFGFFWGWNACRILVPLPEIEPETPALEGGLLTAGLLWKSQFSLS